MILPFATAGRADRVASVRQDPTYNPQVPPSDGESDGVDESVNEQSTNDTPGCDDDGSDGPYRSYVDL